MKGWPHTASIDYIGSSTKLYTELSYQCHITSMNRAISGQKYMHTDSIEGKNTGDSKNALHWTDFNEQQGMVMRYQLHILALHSYQLATTHRTVLPMDNKSPHWSMGYKVRHIYRWAPVNYKWARIHHTWPPENGSCVYIQSLPPSDFQPQCGASQQEEGQYPW